MALVLLLSSRGASIQEIPEFPIPLCIVEIDGKQLRFADDPGQAPSAKIRRFVRTDAYTYVEQERESRIEKKAG